MLGEGGSETSRDILVIVWITGAGGELREIVGIWGLSREYVMLFE